MLSLRVGHYLTILLNKKIIFDLIDVGISILVVDSTEQRLKLLSNTVQIIVITHQLQVTGKADQYIVVEKTQYNLHISVKISNSKM